MTDQEEGGDKRAFLNRKAFHQYHILEKLEAGIALTGTEVKSLREGRMSLGEAYVRTEGGELWLVGAHIPRYLPGGHSNHDPARPRKLLLHREEIDRLSGILSRKGLTLVPLRVYFTRGLAKVEVGVAQGKKLYDKRRALQEREEKREAERALKTHTRPRT